MVTVSEWEPIRGLSKTDSESLELFAIENSEIINLTVIDCKKVIKARNYVGVVGFGDDNHLEILPKIGSSEDKKRSMLMEMLSIALIGHWDGRNSTGVDKNNGILEFYIGMYVKECFRAIGIGLNSDYRSYQSNEGFVRGKILHLDNIKRNSVLKNRFFVEYELFNQDSSENRIVKASLKKLLGISKDNRNKRHMRILLDNFGNVETITDYKTEFQKCTNDRNTIHYRLLLAWSKVFLDGLGFQPIHGTNISYVFLFPMERLYESYVRYKLKDNLPDGWKLTPQDTSKHLFDDKKINIRPDLVLYGNGHTVVMDTKWKDPNNSVSQSDLYQMFIYSVKFHSDLTILLYPEPIGLNYTSADNDVRISSMCFNVENPNGSLMKIKGCLESFSSDDSCQGSGTRS